ncbi:MAG: M6 family metalloprotease domain-containing protein, partial [Caldisericia bacterium]|nr:M6 family metalloprotease domain-containing protein [Caldisericia bacterium]
ADVSVEVNQAITISGSGSDSDGSIVAYQWKEGATILANTASFIYTPMTVASHTLTLTVTDNDGLNDSDTMTVTATEAVVVKEQPLIIIRVEFDDYQFQSPSLTWSNKIFGDSESELNHYMNEISYGSFQFVPAIETEGVADGMITVHLNENHPGMLEDHIDRLATAAQLADAYIDYSHYDSNNNGALDRNELQIMFLVAGGERATSANPGIWAHKWCMYGGNATPPTVDGVSIMNCSYDGGYSSFGEKQFDANTGKDATIGVIAHELGHAVFNLPDLYDTNGGSEGIGNFGLMGGGSWAYKAGDTQPGMTPVHMTGWSKIQSGFVTPTVLSATQANISVASTTSLDYTLYKVPTGTAGEYFLFENRDNSGYDRGFYRLETRGSFKGGLLILHIDDNKAGNTDETHKLVDVEEANNPGLDSEIDRGKSVNFFFAGNKTDFSPTTTPNSNRYNGTSSDVSISNISAEGSNMSLDVDIQ